jgi:hypothetical protein
MSSALFSLPNEVLMHVCVYLVPLDVLNSACTSTAFYKIINNGDLFWRNEYCKNFSFPGSTLRNASARQLQQCCKLALSRKLCNNWYAKAYKEEDDISGFGRYSCPTSILLSQSEIGEGYSWGYERTCLSSSQDQDQEVLESVLPMHKICDDWEQIVAGNPSYVGERCSAGDFAWWSSAPSPLKLHTETNESLLFGSCCGKAIITEVAIKALKDPFIGFGLFDINEDRDDMIYYLWPQISIKIYCLATNDANEDDGSSFLFTSSMSGLASSEDFKSTRSQDGKISHLTCIEQILNVNSPVYESAVMDVRKSTRDSWQHFQIPDGCIGNVIKFTLWGKNICQFPDTGFYTCVKRVAARGVPVIPANQGTLSTLLE